MSYYYLVTLKAAPVEFGREAVIDLLAFRQANCCLSDQTQRHVNENLLFPIVAKPWFWSVTALLFLAEFFTGFKLHHGVGGFFLYMGTVATSALLALEAAVQIVAEICHRVSMRRTAKA